MKNLLLALGVLASQGAIARAQLTGAAAFIPAVEVPDSVARCARTPSSALRQDEVGHLLSFGMDANGSPLRVVSATWDTAGRLRRYSDARGDLRGPPTPVSERELRTTIAIDFVEGTALLMNESHGRTRGAALTTAREAVVTERLGPPQRLLERLHSQCGAPAP